MVNEAVVLDALEAPLVELGLEVQRVNDAPLTAAYRNVAATWEAGRGT